MLNTPEINTQHCLRPELSLEVWQALNSGRSLNLYGQSEKDQERFVDDLKPLIAEPIIFLRCNIKAYRKSYSGFINDLYHQIKKSPEQKSLGALLDWLEAQADKKLCLVLEQFDGLFEFPELDEQYNQDFFDHINSLKNHSQTSLLCLTTKPHNESMIYMKDQELTSWLDLQILEIHDLHYEHIKQELQRQLGQTLTSRELKQIRYFLRKKEDAYDLLVFFIQKIRLKLDTDLLIRRRLKHWHKQYQHKSKTSLFKKLVKLDTYLAGLRRLIAPLILKFMPLVNTLRGWLKKHTDDKGRK